MSLGFAVETADTVSASSLPIGSSTVLAGVPGKKPWISFQRIDPGTHTTVELQLGGVTIRDLSAVAEFDSVIVGAPGDGIVVEHIGVVATTGSYSITCGYVAVPAGPVLSGR